MQLKRILLFLLLAAGHWSAAAAPLRFAAGNEWFRVQQTAPPYQDLKVAFADVNGDGRADLILYAYRTGFVSVALSTGGGFSSPKLFAQNMPVDPSGLFALGAADVNGDGRADLVFMNHGRDDVAGAATAQVALSTGSAFVLADAPWNASWCASYQTCFVADINADRRADLVGFTPNFGLVWASPSSGESFSANTIWQKYFCINHEVCVVGDVDGDGRADIIAFKPNALGVEKGNVLWAKSTGTAFTSIQTGHGYFCITNEQCYVGDVNGDGRTDIIAMKGYGGFGPTLDVLVSLSDGSHFINANPFIWAQVPYLAKPSFGDFAFADVNGDKRADMIQYGVIPRPNGTSLPANFVANVYLSSDQGQATPGPGPAPNPPASFGWSSVKAYNCAINEERINLWTIDLATGERKSTGPIDALYNENGGCPDGRDPPTDLSLTAGHPYKIVAVLPGATGCDGRNDPDIVGCAYSTLFVDAKTTGPACQFYIGGQEAVCALSATTLINRFQSGHGGTLGAEVGGRPPTADQLWSGLIRANIDFSHPEAINDLKSWLADPADTPYPAITQALLGMIGSKRFIAPIYIDVIAYDYEPNQNATRPRTIADVDIRRLQSAVLAASNERNGTHETNFTKLLGP